MYFYDTCALLNLQEEVFEERFAICSQTLIEIENIKESRSKSDDVKYRARKMSKLLAKRPDDYIVAMVEDPCWRVRDELRERGMAETPDNLICCTAYLCKDVLGIPEMTFVTDDLNCLNVAKKIFGLKAEKSKRKIEEEYTGFKIVTMSDEEMADFYEHPDINNYNLITNQYLIIEADDHSVVDCRRWDGDMFKDLYKKKVQSIYFDKLKPKDIYQSCVIDSIMNNTLTAIYGKAGSGKTLLSLMGSMSLIESGKYDRIVALFNPSKARGTTDMGFYGGKMIDKAMQNAIGNILTTKFGDRYAIDVLLQQDKLKLVSMADCRGMEVRDNEILWITEAENTSIDLIRLCLSRVSSGAKVILEGDYKYQTDSQLFDGDKNGLKRVINTLKGQPEVGCVQLQNIWRSKIAELAELL